MKKKRAASNYQILIGKLNNFSQTLGYHKRVGYNMLGKKMFATSSLHAVDLP